jgi:uncharacterized protein (TIGR02117 family)
LSNAGKNRLAGRRRHWTIRIAVRAALLLVVVPLAAGLLYLGAALVLGLVCENRAFRNHAEGTTVYVISNGVHTDLVIPTGPLLASAKWPLRGVAAGPPGATYLAVGWGDREFYLYTPEWSDLKSGTALRALTGQNGSVLHIQAGSAPALSAEAVALHLSDAEFERLSAYIADSFLPDGNGRIEPIPGAHYGAYDVFYAARGHYSVWLTCNEWVREALERAGARVPLWSPFTIALFYQLGQAQ